MDHVYVWCLDVLNSAAKTLEVITEQVMGQNEAL